MPIAAEFAMTPAMRSAALFQLMVSVSFAVVSALVGCAGSESSVEPESQPVNNASTSGSSTEPDPMREVFGNLGESLSQERLERVATVIDRLEAAPHGEHAPGVRFAVLAWLIETPDVSVTLCPFFAGTETADAASQLATDAFNVASHRDVPAAVYVYAYAAGMASYMIRHSGAASDSTEVQVAGLQAMLRVYGVYRRDGLSEAYANIDALQERHERGELHSWHETSVRCGE